MSTVSTFPAFMDALRELLSERAALADVVVVSGPVASPEELGERAIVLGDQETAATYEYLQGPGQLVDEQYDVLSDVVTAVSGGGEDAIKAARDAAFELLEEVHDELAATSATTAGSEAALAAWDARIVAWKADQTIPAPDRRMCTVSFTIRVKARFTPA